MGSNSWTTDPSSHRYWAASHQTMSSFILVTWTLIVLAVADGRTMYEDCPRAGQRFLSKYNLGPSTTVETWEDCGKLCSKTEECRAWTWYSKDDGRIPKQCFLKKAEGYTHAQDNRWTAVSGAKKCTDIDSYYRLYANYKKPEYKLMKPSKTAWYCEEDGYIPMSTMSGFTWEKCKAAATVLGYSGDVLSDTDKWGGSASNDWGDLRPAGCFVSSWGQPASEERFYFNSEKDIKPQSWDHGDKILCYYTEGVLGGDGY